jgi:hypothetical protein
MTTLKSNEYLKLLDYLDKNLDIKKKKLKKEKVKVVKSDTIAKNIEVPKDIIHSDIPRVKHQISSSSNGFDVIAFESLMRSKLIDQHKRMQSYERPYISVSELYSCIRKNYYNRTNYSVDLELQFKFSYLYIFQKIGNAIHDIIQDIYDFSEVEKTVVSEKYKVKGRLDSIKGTCLYEIKSIDYSKLKNKKYIKEHYYQGLIYSYILNTEYNYKIDKICIIYVFRNLKNISAIDLPLDNKLAKSLLERSLILHTSLKQKSVPDPIGASNNECRFCLYKKFCENDECNIKQPFKKEKQVHSKNDEEDKEKRKPVFLL